MQKAVRDGIKSYTTKTPKRVKLLDTYIIFLLCNVATLLVFATLVGTFPFNSLLSALFCGFGAFGLAMSLRLHITSAKDFETKSGNEAFSEFVICNLVLFLAVWNYMG